VTEHRRPARIEKFFVTLFRPRPILGSMTLSMSSDRPLADNPLGDPALRQSLQDFVRRRVPASDVDDVVQTVLCDALAVEGRPGDPAELRRWLLGIARHKVADLHRRAYREPPAELPDIEASPAPIEAHALLHWAEQQAGSTRDAQKTLDWMAREGDGEKLEAIAAEERVPAARVRQRVSRMRRWMKERWVAELAGAAALVALVLVAWWLLRRPDEPAPEAHPDKPRPSSTFEAPSPLEQARAHRDKALEECARAAWQACLDGLDKARALDPEGDKDPAVGAARQQAEEALRSAPPSESKSAPSEKSAPAPKAVPTTTAPPPKPKSEPAPFRQPTKAPRPKDASPVKPAPIFTDKNVSPKGERKSAPLESLEKK
jgi:DNA-directed RNA polymerase specialized sigma24 family protein